MKEKALGSSWDIFTYPDYELEKARFLKLADKENLKFSCPKGKNGFKLVVNNKQYDSYQQYLVLHDNYIVPPKSGKRVRKSRNIYTFDENEKTTKKLRKQKKKALDKAKQFKNDIVKEEDFLSFTAFIQEKLKSRIRKASESSGIKRQKQQLDKILISKCFEVSLQINTA